MREGDFSGTGNRAAADQTGVGNGVVRAAEGAPESPVFLGEADAGGGLDAEDFQKFVERRRGHDTRDAFRDHTFSRAGRADHDEVVPAGHGHLDGAAQRELTFHLGEIRFAGGIRGILTEGAAFRVERRDLNFAAQETHGFVQRIHRVHRHAFDERRLLGRGAREDDAAFPRGARLHGECDAAAHRAHGAGEAEFAGDDEVAQA